MSRSASTRRGGLVLGFLLVALAPLSACNLQLSTDVEAKDQWTRTYPLAPAGTVVILNSNGRIDVTGGEGDSVTITAERIVKAGTEEAAKEQLALLEIQETATPERIEIDSRSKGLTINIQRRVNYTVTMPRNAALTIESRNGDVVVTNIAGHLAADTTNGRITATALEGSAKVNTTNGVISLTFDGVSDEGISADTTNGMISLAVPKTANAELSARVSNGAISSEGLDLRVSEQSRRRLDGRLGTGGPMIRLETTNGAIRVTGRD
jgi:hypothetical protein